MLQITRQLCEKYNIRPVRSKGQNFLINPVVYDKIVEIANLSKKDNVLEVGPGLGFLTERLAQKAKQVLAVELDDKLAIVLQERLAEQHSKNITVLNADVLDFPNLDFPKGFLSNYHVVANLPYNITSVFLRKLLSAKHQPKTMTLLVQKEVAERITAQPGQMSLLALSVQFYAKAKVEHNVLAEDFWPQPKVNSSVLHLEINNEYVDKLGSEAEQVLFFRIIKFGFSAKRKMLKNNLSSGLKVKQEKIIEILEKNNFDAKIRAQNLSVQDWIKLFGILRDFVV
ncbi:MAG: 16S rRNA (adenine(1518)-N(6)/adenine(1519)-N(6))-dimethyltransferase RsmA [bacterium]